MADTTPAGSEMLNTCLARSGNPSKSSFSMKPASVTRFIECYLTVNEKRLCNEVQRRVLMDVTDLMQIAIMASAKPKPGEPNQVLPEWDLPVNKSNAAALTSLFKRGYLTASDMEWAPPDMVDAHYGLGVFTPNPCLTARR